MTKRDSAMDIYGEGAEEKLAKLNDKLRELPAQNEEETLQDAWEKAKAVGTAKARIEYAKLKREMGR